MSTTIRVRNRRIVRGKALLIGFIGTAAFIGLWWNGRPEKLGRLARATLAARDWERLQYQRIALPPTGALGATNCLVSAALELERREFPAALRDLKHAADDPTIRPLAWLLAGQVLYAQNRFREAEANFKIALQLDPTLIDAHRWLAIAYYDIGLVDEALRHLQRIADLDPRDPRPHRIMAVIHMDHGSYAIAVEDFEESLRRDPHQQDGQEILEELSQTQLALKRYEDAQRTLAECEQTSKVLAMRADALYALGDAKEANRLARAALNDEPRQRLALLVLGRLALDIRDYDRAIDLLYRAADVAPSDYDLQYTLLTALRAAGHVEEADKQLIAVEELRRQREKFDLLLEQAIADPYNAEIRFQLGVLADRLKMPRVAQSWLKAAVVLDPKHRLAESELKKYDSVSTDAEQLLRGS